MICVKTGLHGKNNVLTGTETQSALQIKNKKKEKNM